MRVYVDVKLPKQLPVGIVVARFRLASPFPAALEAITLNL